MPFIPPSDYETRRHTRQLKDLLPFIPPPDYEMITKSRRFNCSLPFLPPPDYKIRTRTRQFTDQIPFKRLFSHRPQKYFTSNRSVQSSASYPIDRQEQILKYRRTVESDSMNQGYSTKPSRRAPPTDLLIHVNNRQSHAYRRA
ncbi:hypothetical protein AB6A40_007930 [Gnathostoma spinigerum]|uniref:Uncharacterized protein n=1 Tax=Gnathostoma spinigerum TaxID=75299 RepID=A0ABD6EUU2_9BILA